MFKMLFSTVLLAAMLVLGNGFAHAATVAIALDTPAGMFSEPEKVNESLQATLDKIFAGNSNLTFLPIEDATGYLRIYREEHDLIEETYSDSDFVRMKTLKKEDYYNVCKYFNADYLIYVNVTNSIPKSSGGLLTSGQSVNVTTDFRVWSNAKNDFAFMKRLSAKGSSNTIYAGGSGSSSRAVEKGLKKCLSLIEKEGAKINAAISG